jgi:hypothetical protein
MSELIVISDRCGNEGHSLLESDNFCSNCGHPAIEPAAENQSTGMIERRQQRLATGPQPLFVTMNHPVSVVEEALNNRLVVTAILLLAGPIGLPALWFSPKFSGRAKIFATSIYFLITAMLPLAAAWYFLDVALRPLFEVFNR